MRLPSPYTPGAGARPPVLSGREELLARAEVDVAAAATLRRPASAPLVWTGVRGVGKTVALAEVRRTAESVGVLTVHLTVERDRSLARRLAEACAAAMAEAGVDRRGRLWARVVERLAAFDVELSVGGVVTVRSEGRPGAVVGDVGRDQLRQLLEDVTDQAVQAGRPGLLLTLDEIQEAPSDDLVLLVNTLQDLTSGQRPVVTVLAGLPGTPEALMRAGSFAERFAYSRLRNLEPEAARRAVVEPAANLDVRWEPDAVQLVTALAAGAPFLLQLYADNIWRLVDPDRGGSVDLPTARAGVLAAEESLWDGQYRGRWARATRAERAMLGAIAAALDPHTRVAQISAVGARLGKKSKQMSKARADLIDKGLLEPVGRGELAFTVPGFEWFVLAQVADSASDRPDLPTLELRAQHALPPTPPSSST
ncbi:MAG: ATP-binding protein [Nocardioides sp.]|nr:ATP-binding protein [Nocardioides sp.]